MGRSLCLLLGLTACLGCGIDDGAVPEYFVDVAPRLGRSCLPCHLTGDARRPSFATLEGVRTQASLMLLDVQTGRMPPGGIDRTGACNTFVGPAPFTAEDTEVFQAWIAGGMPADPRGAPSPRQSLATPTGAPSNVRAQTLTLPFAQGEEDEHRCFVIEDLGPTHLAGVASANPSGLHHLMVFAIDEAATAAARALDDEDDLPGWRCPSTSLVPTASLAFTWVPGQVATFPEGTGVPLSAAAVIQIHQSGPHSDTLMATLLLRDDVQQPIEVVPIAATGFSLPPGEPRVVFDQGVPLSRGGLVVGVMPHQHRAGRGVRLDLDDGVCLMDAPRFDYLWQEVAFYEAAVSVDAGRRLQLHCEWDTRDRDVPLRWGEGSDDEMCTVFLFIVGRPSAAPEAE